MTNYEQHVSFSLEELAEWIAEYGQFDGSPWMTWFNETYCNKCESIKCRYPDGKRDFECAYCEWEKKCRFLPELKEPPSCKEIITLWLKENA